MGVQFGNYTCEDPGQLLQSCQEATPPINPHQWLNKANRFTHTIGLRPGTGFILLTSQILSQINPSGVYSLTFNDQYYGATSDPPLVLTNIRIVGAPVCVSTGSRGTAAQGAAANFTTDAAIGTYLVEVADRRIDCEGIANRRYNWRNLPTDATYIPSTTADGAGTPWTYATLIADLWQAVGNLGPFPACPRPVTGTAKIPEQVDCHAVRAADAARGFSRPEHDGRYLRSRRGLVRHRLFRQYPDRFAGPCRRPANRPAVAHRRCGRRRAEPAADPSIHPRPLPRVGDERRAH